MTDGFKIKIGRGPICPKCGCDGFDDWWHDKSCMGPVGIVSIYATLTCHGCGERFDVARYRDGDTHSVWPATPKEALFG